MLNKLNLKTVVVGGGLLLCGCASSTDEIATAYVSPLAYEGYTCRQVALELDRVSRRVQDLGGMIDDKAEGDAVATGIGIVLLWPALFFIDGDGPETYEYGRLKGEHETLQKVAIQKKCGLKFSDPEADRRANKKAKREEIEKSERVGWE